GGARPDARARLHAARRSHRALAARGQLRPGAHRRGGRLCGHGVPVGGRGELPAVGGGGAVRGEGVFFVCWLRALAGCAPPVPHVEQSVAYTTGNTTFDEFFAAVKEVRENALAGPGDDPAQAALIKLLGLEPKAASTLAVDEASQRAKKIAERGVL